MDFAPCLYQFQELKMGNALTVICPDCASWSKVKKAQETQKQLNASEVSILEIDNKIKGLKTKVTEEEEKIRPKLKLAKTEAEKKKISMHWKMLKGRIAKLEKAKIALQVQQFDLEDAAHLTAPAQQEMVKFTKKLAKDANKAVGKRVQIADAMHDIQESMQEVNEIEEEVTADQGYLLGDVSLEDELNQEIEEMTQTELDNLPTPPLYPYKPPSFSIESEKQQKKKKNKEPELRIEMADG